MTQYMRQSRSQTLEGLVPRLYMGHIMNFVTVVQQISTVFEFPVFHTESHGTLRQDFSTLATALRLDYVFCGILYTTWRV